MKTAAALLLACGFAFAGPALAQAVALSGMLGSRALLVVDGSAPKVVGTGESHRGVKLIAIQADQALVEVAGTRQTLRLGEAPVNIKGRGGDVGNGRIVLQAGSGGHFVSSGQINGRTVQLVVDTGASVVSMGAADAERIGLNYRNAQPVHMSTANGETRGWSLKLASVRLGTVDVYDVDAVVMPGTMPYILLGNSFLTRFQMTQTNDQLVLDKRY